MKPEMVDVNRHIGARLRLLRGKLGLSLKKVGTWLDVSHQQISNYEDGAHRLSADALFVLSREMNVDPGFFFEGLFGSHSKHGLADPAAAGGFEELLLEARPGGIQGFLGDLSGGTAGLVSLHGR